MVPAHSNEPTRHPTKIKMNSASSDWLMESNPAASISLSFCPHALPTNIAVTAASRTGT